MSQSSLLHLPQTKESYFISGNFFVPASTGTLYKMTLVNTNLTSCARGDTPPPPASWQYLRIYSPCGTCSGKLAIWDISHNLTFDLLTLKVVSESLVTWATSVPILVFLGFSVLELGPMYVTDVRQTDVRQKHRLMPPPYGGWGIIKTRRCGRLGQLWCMCPNCGPS